MGEQLEPGHPVGDRYVIEGLLGVGGIAEVYKVRHVELGSVYALKVLTWRRKGLAERFLKEGRFQSQLRHPNVVTVNDILRFDGQVALVMEFVDGTNLEQLVAEVGALPVQDAFALFVPILAAVAAAHDKGVWHRDLKPANILLARTPVGWVPKVADFGIAKFVHEEMGKGNTATGMTMGTPGYMAPEQIRDSSSVDGRADVFALGAILHEMLTGKKAFADTDGGVSLLSTLDRDPAPIAVPDVSPSIVEALGIAMARDREARFPDCRTFARALGIGAHPLLLDLPDGRAMVASFDAAAARSLLSPPSTIPPKRTLSTPSGGWLMVPFAAGTAALAGVGVLMLLAVLIFVAARHRWESGVAVTSPIAQGVPPPVPVAPEPEVRATAIEVPSPVVPELGVAPPVPAPAAAPESPAPAPVAAPDAIEVVEPEPVVAPPEPEPEPEDAVAEVAPPEPVIAPAPAPDPTPTAEPPVEPFDPMTLLKGNWVGKASGRPMDLTFEGMDRGYIEGAVLFVIGTGTRRVPLTGTYDRASGRLALRSSDGKTTFDGRLANGTISGTYANDGGRPMEWSVRRP